MNTTRSVLRFFVVGLLTSIAGSALATDLPTQLSACRAIASDVERVACYDAIVDGAGEASPAPVLTPAASVTPAAVPPPPAAPEPAPAAPEPAPIAVVEPVAAEESAPEEAFGKTAGQIKREQRERFGQADIRELEATVVKLRKMGNYKVEITLDNGQRWQQVTSSYLKLKVGDNIVIKRAALESYKLVKVGNNRAMKVRRAD